MSKQFKQEEIDSKFKVTIWLQSDTSYYVTAPLPAEYGFSVGANYSTPFDMQGLGENIQKLAALANISQKMTMNMEKVFINPEPTEISLEMEFNAFYSAKDEVLIPIIKLLDMALASQLSFGDAKESINKLIEKAGSAASKFGVNLPQDTMKSYLNTSEETNEVGGKAFSLLRLIKSPEMVNVSFGEVYTLKNVYISSAAPSFSNVLDEDGYPLSAKCNLTFVLRDVPLKETLSGEWFEGIG